MAHSFDNLRNSLEDKYCGRSEQVVSTKDIENLVASGMGDINALAEFYCLYDSSMDLSHRYIFISKILEHGRKEEFINAQLSAYDQNVLNHFKNEINAYNEFIFDTYSKLSLEDGKLTYTEDSKYAEIKNNIIPGDSNNILTKEEYISALDPNETFNIIYLAYAFDRFDILKLLEEEILDQSYEDGGMFHIISTAVDNYIMHKFIPFDERNEMQKYDKFIKLLHIEHENGSKYLDLLVEEFEELDIDDKELLDESMLNLIKNPDSIEKYFADLSKTYIAVSVDGDSWLTYFMGAMRKLMQDNPNVQFYLVNEEVLNNHGDYIYEKFDGLINPGAHTDSYPFSKAEFGRQDCDFSLKLEKMYQSILDNAAIHKTPTFGICAGAQAKVLHENGRLKEVDAYDKEYVHAAEFKKGSIGYLLSLTKPEQVKMFEQKIMPGMKYLVATHHHYAAVNENMGAKINLDAVSEDNIAMCYTSLEDGVYINTQFHPEEAMADSYDKYAKLSAADAEHQRAILDNFINISKLNHMYKTGEIQNHPQDHLKAVQAFMNGCETSPHEQCLIQEYKVALGYGINESA